MVDFAQLLKHKHPTGSVYRKEVEIVGTRTDCFTNKETLVKLAAYLEDGPRGKIFEISGGPTGYESFYLNPEVVRTFREDRVPWVACMGTKNSWDRLVIENDQILKAFDMLGVK